MQKNEEIGLGLYFSYVSQNFKPRGFYYFFENVDWFELQIRAHKCAKKKNLLKT